MFLHMLLFWSVVFHESRFVGLFQCYEIIALPTFTTETGTETEKS